MMELQVPLQSVISDLTSLDLNFLTLIRDNSTVRVQIDPGLPRPCLSCPPSQPYGDCMACLVMCLS